MMIKKRRGYMNSDAIEALVGQKDQRLGWITMILPTDANGSVSYCDHEVDEVAAMINATIIRAEPGYVMLQYAGGGADEFYVSRSTVIAWRLDRAHRYVLPEPVTVDGCVDRFSDRQAILCPDGCVVQPDIRDATVSTSGRRRRARSGLRPAPNISLRKWPAPDGARRAADRCL